MKPHSGKTRWLLAAMLSALTLLSVSCQTSPKSIPEIPINLDWPAPPDPKGKVIRLEEPRMMPAGTVVMPLDYWLALSRYIVDAERVRKQVEVLYGTNGK